ncbi:glycosyltransferase family 4 protein [Pyramidobacter sp. SM-530-WT-4B]|uniref:Glycosyltransferase family 4 protein n=1 Tax=Pyramidobacter porci TaxID=2605789 RepID=A0A6L5Y8K2_9BACT|nr:glycosyltransferase family 4 protein [Pyramidobacter porci]MST54629.1 glycosyltransferase family 4 protein [Pyramidobacter porci]
MKIIHILPELQIGGVERHVIDLSNELVGRGHEIMVISAGGQMERQLDSKVLVRHLPVHKKNPLTGFYSAVKIARWIRHERWQLIHAHSRVPAWIASWASSLARVPWLYTAHAVYSHNLGLYPLKRADKVICVSRAVKDDLSEYIPANSQVIYNGLPESVPHWRPLGGDTAVILAVGRLTRLKGIDTVLRALALLKQEGICRWKFVIVGDGPQKRALEERAAGLDIASQVEFTGYREDIIEKLLNCSCYVLPSISEGMGLTLMLAAKMGVPVLASDLPAICELTLEREKLLPPAEISAWTRSLRQILSGCLEVAPKFDESVLLTEAQMAGKLLAIYQNLNDTYAEK